MRLLLTLFALFLPLAACGFKGGLKSPSQIEAQQEKKEHKEAREKARQEKEKTKAEEKKKQQEEEEKKQRRGEEVWKNPENPASGEPQEDQ